jgi:hypothetical protein
MELKNDDAHFLHPRMLVVAGIVLGAAALRLAPHPMNFTPVGALALFSGAYFSSKRAALVVPLLSLMVGDILTGFHRLIPFVYASFLVSVGIGFCLRRIKTVPRIGAATLASAVQFYLITNFALWASSIGSFPKNIDGLVACYIAGFPLFWNTLAGDAFYAALLFGVMALAARKLPLLEKPLAAHMK